MQAFNRIILVGRLVADPELRSTPDGRSLVRFRIAVNRRFRSADAENSDNVDFIDVVSFRESVVNFVSTYLTKGRLVLVEGELRINRWKAPDGTFRRRCEVMATDVQAMETKSSVDSMQGINTVEDAVENDEEGIVESGETLDFNEEIDEDSELLENENEQEDEDEPPF